MAVSGARKSDQEKFWLKAIFATTLVLVGIGPISAVEVEAQPLVCVIKCKNGAAKGTCCTTKCTGTCATICQKTGCKDYVPDDFVVEMVDTRPNIGRAPSPYVFDGLAQPVVDISTREFARYQDENRAKLINLLMRATGRQVNNYLDPNSIILNDFDSSYRHFSLKNITPGDLKDVYPLGPNGIVALDQTTTRPQVSFREVVQGVPENTSGLINKLQVGLQNSGGAFVTDIDGGRYTATAGWDIGVLPFRKDGKTDPGAWGLEGNVGTSVGRSGVVVAVIDVGFNLQDSEYVKNLYTNDGEAGNKSCDGKDNDGNGFIDDYRGWDSVLGHGCVAMGALREPDGSNGHGHGTHVASIIGASPYSPSQPTSATGVAPFVSIYPIKAYNDSAGGFDTANLVDAYRHVLALKRQGVGIEVVNASFAGPCSTVGQAERNALQDLVAAGITVVGAAGNEKRDNDLSPQCPGNLGATQSTPSGVPGIISVGMSAPGVAGTNSGLHRWSNFGKRSVTTAAPGTAVYADRHFRSGTSMAAAHVSGIVALMKSVNPWVSPAWIEGILASGNSTKGANNLAVQSGGIVNASSAVAAAMNSVVAGRILYHEQPVQGATVKFSFDTNPNVLNTRTTFSGVTFVPRVPSAQWVTVEVVAGRTSQGLSYPAITLKVPIVAGVATTFVTDVGASSRPSPSSGQSGSSGSARSASGIS